MKAKQHHLIADTTGERVDAFLARCMPLYSRSVWQKICAEGGVTVQSRTVKASFTLTEGTQITVSLPRATVEPRTVPVIYEDDDIVVLNKPAGMLTHAKGALSSEYTIATFMRTHTTDGLDTNRPGIVHRLDRATSGVIVAAKHAEAKRWLQKQFAERKVKKTYIALVRGKPKEHEARLELPIERNPRHPYMFKVGANGKYAETSYSVTKYYTKYSLLKLQPYTGRTHQLRVHCAYLGTPIVGDKVYGIAEPSLGRMFLHAHTIELTTPSRRRKVFTAPLPEDLERFLQEL